MKFGISLNPKKSNFALEEGKLLGHIICQYGIKIDPSKVEAIQNIEMPRSKKEVQYCICRVNLLSRFILNFAEIMKHITSMIRKYNQIKWTMEAKKSFSDINKALIEAPILISLEFTKYFQIFSFASERTIVGVLL